MPPPPAAAWAAGVEGLADVQLQRLRTCAGVATRSTAAGRSLTLDLALANSDGLGSSTKDTDTSDPFIAANVGPILVLGQAVWNGTVPIAQFQITLWGEAERLRSAKMPWKQVRGPTGAFLATLARLGWKARAAR